MGSGQHNPGVATLKRIIDTTGTGLIIEFRWPRMKHERRASRRPSPSSSSSGSYADESLAASPTED